MVQSCVVWELLECCVYAYVHMCLYVHVVRGSMCVCLLVSTGVHACLVLACVQACKPVYGM